ncbi:MAG: F0F1 ATP synthase subunit epsilon [Melioribacteraceae bacterium]|nr:F0F1 ATP synthase subunit epsilon [Melioribacteraceae bacterium]MCF8355103.1 F0F1 ATP synthase subunit epsilon [Melioribacteraceae bacterium]MCF8395071.1 F0F1 ATP synthase subunit epsilon [Melioribacteraceae bacterium]MCF8420321.1 F0F1 ATP synthase subunit epsilon [Melioribacteraceae bacterium]
MKELTLEIVTPSKVSFRGMVKSITVPGTEGSFQVLFNHAPIISSLDIGVVKIVDTEGNEKKYSCSGGTVEVLKNQILLLAESFESKDEIDVDRAKDALNRAKKRLSRKNEEEVDLTRAEASLQRAVNRLKLTGNAKFM